MSLPKTFISVAINEVDFDNHAINNKALKCDIFLNTATIDTFLLSETHTRSIVPILSGKDRVRFVIKDVKTNSVLGCISFSIDLFISFRGSTVEHWITLFDSSEDDEYDGDLTEDDEEAPRALFSFAIDSAANLRKLNETLVKERTALTPEKLQKETITIHMQETAKFPLLDLHMNLNLAEGVENKSEEVTEDLNSEDLDKTTESNKNTTQTDPQEASFESTPSQSQKEDQPSELEESAIEHQSANDKTIPDEDRSQQNTHEEEEEEVAQESEQLYDNQTSILREKPEKSVVLEIDAEQEHPLQLEYERHSIGNEQKDIYQSDREEEVQQRFSAKSNTKSIQPVEDKNDVNKSTVTNDASEEYEVKETETSKEEPVNSKILESYIQADKQASIVSLDTSRTTSRMEKEAELRKMRLELERMSEIYADNERLTFALKVTSTEYEEVTKKMQAQIADTNKAFKTLNEENMKLKEKVKNLEALIDLKSEALVETSRIQSSSQVKQSSVDKVNSERQILRIENLENIVRDLRDQLQQAHNTDEANNEQNKSLIKSQHDLLEKIKETNEETSELRKRLKEQTLEFSRQKEAFEHALAKKENDISEQNSKAQAQSENLKRLVKDKEKLHKELDLVRIQHESHIKELEDKLKLKEEELANKRASSISNNELELENELETVRKEKNAIDIELQQLKARNYEREIWKVQKNFELSEIARQKLQDELANAHKHWQVVTEDYQNRNNTEVNSEDFELAKKQIKELTQELRQKELGFDKISNQNNELILQSKHNELNSIERERTLKELERVQTSNEELTSELRAAKDKYYQTSEDLIKQQTHNSEQRHTIRSLTKKLHALEKSLTNAFTDIQKLEVSLGTSHASMLQQDESQLQNNLNIQNTLSNPSNTTTSHKSTTPKASNKSKVPTDEVNHKLEEYMKKNKLVVKFVKVGDGFYTFGSKKVHVKILNDRLVIRIGGGYMFIEQFIKMYANAELVKMKQFKENEIKYTDLDDEELPSDFKTQQFAQEEANTGPSKASPFKKKLEQAVTNSYQSPSKRSVQSTQRGSNSKPSTQQNSYGFETFGASVSTSVVDTERTNTTEDALTDRKSKLSKDVFSNASPNMDNKSRSRKSTMNRLSQDLQHTRTFVEPVVQKGDKSPIDSYKRKTQASASNSRDISPFQRNYTSKTTKARESSSINNLSFKS